MPRKAKDLLELYRKVEPQTDEAAGLEPTPRMLVLRQSQVVVAAVAGALVVVLAFLIGLAAGGGDEEADANAGGAPWVIRVATYADSDQGRRSAKTVASFLEKKGLGEVTLQHLPEQEAFVVTLGAWVKHPERYRPALDLRKKVREIPDVQTGGKPFVEADFWRIKR